MSSDYWQETERKARKPYICYECGETINPGDQYFYIRQRQDGKYHHYHYCLRCQDLAELLEGVLREWPEWDGATYYMGHLHETALEYDLIEFTGERKSTWRLLEGPK